MRNHVQSGSVRLWQQRFVVATIIAIPVVYFSMIQIFGESAVPLANQLAPWSALVSFIAATIAVIYLGSSFAYSTFRGLRNRMFNTDSLITIGTATAYVYSWISYLVYIIQNHTIFLSPVDPPQLYFTTVVLLFAFVTVGKWIENRATDRAERSIRQLIRLRPRRAHLVNGGSVADIPADQIRPGDTLLVKPGETIPTDGRIVSGSTSVNESMITGESVAVDKHIGSQVIGGTTNGHGTVEMVAERVRSDTMLAQIIQLINTARNSRTPMESLADRISSVFVPFVIMLALVTFFVWYFYVGVDASSAMIMFVSVLMVACPYAFGLAAPSAVTVGIGIGSRNGILIKDSNAIQQLSRIDTVVFDKTGTLTYGRPVVTDVIPLVGNAKRALTIAASLEHMSEHSLAQAIIHKADGQHLVKLPVRHFATVPGKGIAGTINSTRYYLGSEELVRQYIHTGLPDVSKLAKASKTITYLFTNHRIIAVIAVADQPRTNAAKAIRQLRQMRINTYLLSGDNEAATASIAKRLGIKNIIADVMPDDKANAVIALRRQGRRVAMVGDGINDAPAIASANVGIAIGTGTDAAIETGDIVIVSGDPTAICNAIRLAKATTSKIRQNLFFSLFYNVISVPIAAGALSAWGIAFHPELAGLIMAMSSVAVIVNSLTLRLADITKAHEPARLVAPLILFLLFTVVYMMFVFSGAKLW